MGDNGQAAGYQDAGPGRYRLPTELPIQDQAGREIQNKRRETGDHGKVHKSLLSEVGARKLRAKPAEVWHSRQLSINNHSHFVLRASC